MRTVLVVTIVLALFAPAAASAARTNASADLNQMVSAYRTVTVVRVVERFEGGGVATVDVMPSGQYRVASTGGEDPALIVKLATRPIPDATASSPAYAVKSLGSKTIDGVRLSGYSIASADGSYTASVWVNQNHLPVSADVQTEGKKINLSFGNYNNGMLIGAR